VYLPESLIQGVREGRVVLFLGAGACKGATVGDGGDPPLGDSLRDLLAARFLGNHSSRDPLAWVAELAITATDLFTVQDFIADHKSVPGSHIR